MTVSEKNSSPAHRLPEVIQRNATDRRVLISPVPAPATTPKITHASIESVSNHGLEIFVQCLYMVPVVGNAMSLYDVGADIYRLCSVKGESKNPFNWAILVVDAIGIVPAAGNASRPARAVVKEVLLAFARGAGAAVVVDLFWATAGGDAIKFMSELDTSLARWKAEIVQGIREATRTIRAFVANPVSVAEQMGHIKKNKGFLSWVPSSEEIALHGLDGLLKVSGLRQTILDWLDEFDRDAGPMLDKAFGDAVTAGSLIYMATQIAGEIAARRAHKLASHTAQAVPGTMREPHAKRGEHRDSTQKGARPSDLPAKKGCGCPVTTSPKPVNFAMGDENLEHTDFVLDGIVPIVWTRRYRSSLAAYDASPLGARWSSDFHLSLEERDGALVYFDADSRAVPLPLVAVGDTVAVPTEQLGVSRPDARHVRLAWPDGSSEHYERYGTANRYRLRARTRRDGLGLTLDYNEAGELVSVSDGAENNLRLEYLDGRIAAIYRTGIPGAGNEALAQYTYDEHGNLITQADVLGFRRTYGWNGHLLARYTDYNGNAANLAWAWPGMHEGVPAPADAKCCRTWLGDGERDIREDTRFEYAREHWHTKVTDADGNVTIHRYDYHNRIVLVEHPDGSSESFEWDDNHNLTGVRNALGQTQRFEYDAQGRVTATTDALGNTTRTEYDADGLPVKVTAANGDVTQTAYDESGRPVSITDASGRTTAYRWSGSGLLLSLTDPKGGSRGFRYDNGGRLIEATDCSGYSTQYVYDERGYLSRRIDAEGHSTLYRCDARGQVVKITHPDGTDEQFTWDGEGNLKRHCDGAGQVTEYSHNARGQLVYRKDAAGRSLSYQYDRLWRLASLHNGNGEKTEFRYDALGQLVGQTGLDGSTVEYTWNEAGQLAGKREGDIETQYVRDPLGRLTGRRTEGPANSGVTSVSEHFHYDARGRLVTARTNGSVVRLHYDDAGNLVAEQRSVVAEDGLDYVTVTRHTYDALGNRTATVLPNTRRIDWLRYGSGHVHGVLLDGAPLLDFERDRLHRETGRSHAAFTQTREYDPMGRLARFVARPAAAGPHERLAERRLSYAATGNLVRIADHSRGVTDYTYDPVGRLLKSVTPDLTEVFAFDAAGNPVDPEKVPPRPVVETAEELAVRRAVEQAEDAAWLRAHPGEKSPPLRYNERGVEDRRRLDRWEASLPRCVGDVLKELNRTRYGHDARGNLARRVEPDGTTWLYRYDAANRLIEAQRFAKPPQADELERMEPIDGGGWRFVEAGVQPALKVSFAYDAFGRRTQKKVRQAGGEIERTFFTWDGDVLLMEERFHRPVKREHIYRDPEYRRAKVVREDPDDVDSLPVAQRMHTLDTHHEWQAASLYLHEPGTFVPLARLDEKLVEAAFLATGTDGGFVQVPAKTRHATYFYQNDHLGTPQELVDASGKVVWLARYKAWGGAKRPPYGQSDPGEVDNRIRFQGQYHDEETGLCYNRHRYYDPGTGRYISKDPIGLAGGLNVYQYAKGNPLRWIDPLGLAPCPGRKGAFRQAKRDLGIPLSRQPDRVLNERAGQMGQYNQVMMTGSDGSPVLDKNSQPIWTREYQFTRSDGGVVLVQDHGAGHNYGEGGVGDHGPHFNARPCSNPRTGKVPGTQAHYPF